MGNARGTAIVVSFWGAVRDYIPHYKRHDLLAQIMYNYANATDWDTEDEIKGIWAESELALALYWAIQETK